MEYSIVLRELLGGRKLYKADIAVRRSGFTSQFAGQSIANLLILHFPDLAFKLMQLFGRQFTVELSSVFLIILLEISANSHPKAAQFTAEFGVDVSR